MRFFTPDLLQRYNSTDQQIADQANEEWEAVLASYRTHLDGIRDTLPLNVRKLADLCLHDAEFLACNEVVEPCFPYPMDPLPPHWAALAIVCLRRDETITLVIYTLWDRIEEIAAAEDWPFSKQRSQWLYDEIDTIPGAIPRYRHRVLLSDGRIFQIPFLSATVQTVPTTAPHGNEARQSA